MKKAFIFLVFMLGVAVSQAQTLFPVNVSINMVPPYSTRLSDYANNPGKVLITLRNTQTREVTVYLRATISGDNGIMVYTSPDFRPVRGITLRPNIPFTLTVGDLQEVFDVNQLNTRGITMHDIERKNGLPEGVYQVCVRAYDFTRHTVPLSSESPLGCTTIRLTSIEPPMLIKPFENEEVTSVQPQNIIFSWSLPAGAPPGTRFRIKLIELLDPKRNPNDAFLAGTQPPFFEKVVTGNVYVYGPADPALADGRKYAWAVTALDPNESIRSEGTAFRNGGRSEVRAFTWKQRRTAALTDVQPGKNAPAIKATPKLDPEMDITKLLTSVSGKLIYSYPEDYKMIPVIGKHYQTLTADNFSARSQHRPGGGLLENLYEAPAYLSPKPDARPARKVKVMLMMVYAYHDALMTGSGVSLSSIPVGHKWNILTSAEGTLLINNKATSLSSVSQVLATGFTNDNGEFNLTFAMKDTSGMKSMKSTFGSGEFKGSYEGAVRKTCVLIVDSPYYCTPFIMVNARPGDNIVLPELVSLVKSQELTIIARNNEKEGQMGSKEGKLENVNIELFRLKPMEVDLPEGEGQNLPPSAVQALQMGDYSKMYPITKVGRTVAVGRTGAGQEQGKFKVQRVIRINTRASDSFIAHSYSDKNVGVYNKFDGIKVVDAVSYPQLGGIDIPSGNSPEWNSAVEFNSLYRYTGSEVETVMLSKNPAVKGKVVEKNMGLASVQVLLKTKVTTTKVVDSGMFGLFKEEVKTTEWKPLAAMVTKDDGYFEFKDLKSGDYLLEFSKPGYKPVLYPDGNTIIGNMVIVLKPFTLMTGQLLQTNDIVMNPSGRITACVSDEDGHRVVSDIRVGDGAFYKTIESGVMKGCVVDIPAQVGKARTIKVNPRASDVYFDGEFTYDIQEEGTTNIPAGTLAVLRKKHRIRVQVNGRQGSNVMPLEGAAVTIKEYTALTNAKGQALLEFESPGTEFVVAVKPAADDNFSHWEEKVTIPVTRTPVQKVVDLTPARTVLATVKESIDGKTGPSSGARVYIKTLKTGWGNSTVNYAECTTDASGQCTLKGIPVTENNLEVFVAKESDKGTFVGEKKEAFWMNGQFQSKVELTLTLQSGFKINDVWGFPVNIETAQAQADGSYRVSGSLRDIPGNPNFSSTDGRLDFKDVRFVAAPGNGNTHQPEKDAFPLEQKSFKVKIGQGLQGVVAPTPLQYVYSLNFPRIQVTRNSQGKGELRAAARLELSSFEGTYQLSGKIELGENMNPGDILIFSAANLPKRRLNLGTSSSNSSMVNLKYKVHNFPAEAEKEQSYISGDSVNFYTVLHTNIPDMVPSDLAVKAGYITVLPNKILPFSGGEDISFSLEKWKVTGQKPATGQVWTYDLNNGGISIAKAVVNTGVVAVGLSHLIIKPDRLIADKLDLNSSDAGAFSLGGIVPLEIKPGTQTMFAYDPNCYHDNKPHWKLTLAGKSGTVAAEVSNLDGLAAGDKLQFGSMNLFSDNQQQLNGPSSKSLTLFKVLKFSLNTIDVGKDFFTLVGQASMDIPNMSSGGNGIVGQIIYAKNASGKIKADIKPLYFEVEGKGQVTFKADDAAKSQSISDGLYTSKGMLKIYDTPSSQWFSVEALLTHRKTGNGFSTSVEVLEKQKIPLEGKFLEIKPGLDNSSMKVAGGAWQNLVLSTVLPESGFQNMSKEEADRSLTFVVKGALETDPSKGKLGVTGMDTGFGNMSLFYNFARQEVRGDFTLVLPEYAPIKCGIVDITSIGGAVVIGTGGMYMRTSATGLLTLAGLPTPINGTVNLLLGYYNKSIYPEDLSTLTQLAVNKSYPAELNSGIKGMYSSYTLSIDKTVGRIRNFAEVAKVGVEAYVRVAYEYRTFLNFRSATSFDVETGMFGYGEAGVDAVAELPVGGVAGHLALNVQLSLKQKASPEVGISAKSIAKSIKSLKMEGCGSVGGSVKIEVCPPVLDCYTLINFNENISARFTISTRPDISLSFDSCGNGMPMETLSTQK
ncbi:hypothetical protein [Leadbetterella sp. DM7]|uniref:hypothetical protein n=1 Tax=Leadbetterella sp. DM7 TaxID=3235085 RepID=UPI00349E9678